MKVRVDVYPDDKVVVFIGGQALVERGYDAARHLALYLGLDSYTVNDYTKGMPKRYEIKVR